MRGYQDYEYKRIVQRTTRRLGILYSLVVLIAITIILIRDRSIVADLEDENRRLSVHISALKSQLSDKTYSSNYLSERVEELEVYRLESIDLLNRCEELESKIIDLEYELKLSQSVELPTYEYTNEELEVLFKCVQAEAGDGNYESEKLITQVILNRVKSKGFPNNIYDVIYQKGQFSVTVDGNLDRQVVSDKTYKTVMSVLLTGGDLPDNVLYFYGDRYVRADHWIRTLPVYNKVEGTVFAYEKR